MAGMFDQFLKKRSQPVDVAAATKEFGELQKDRNYIIGNRTKSARFAGQKPTEYPPEQKRAMDRGRELESIMATARKAPNTDFQGIPTSPGGKLGRTQYLTADIRQIIASNDRFAILQAADEIRTGMSTWSPAWRDVNHPMHGPVTKGFAALVEALDDLDRK